jgi:hypothetical protein
LPEKSIRSVTVEGRVLNFFTRQPLATLVVLRADDVHTWHIGDGGEIILGQTISGTDGRFKIESKPTKGNNYYLEIEGKDISRAGSRIHINGKGQTDIGDVLAGFQDFYCRVTVRSVSGKCLLYNDPSTVEDIRFEPGSNTSFVVRRRFSKNIELSFYNFYRIAYCGAPPIHWSQYSGDKRPIVNSDTLRQEILY